MNDESVNAYVLDSFAVLAYLEGEVAMETVQSRLRSAEAEACAIYLSIINLGEVLYITERERGLTQAHAVLATVEQLPIQLLPADRETVLAAAHIKASYPLSYADAFVVATAQRRQATILTGDPEFHSVEDQTPVEWLQQSL